jgi:hypothetical protein
MQIWVKIKLRLRKVRITISSGDKGWIARLSRECIDKKVESHDVSCGATDVFLVCGKPATN